MIYIGCCLHSKGYRRFIVVISNASIKELVVTKEELTDEQITSLYNHGIGIKNIQNNSLFCDLSDFDISAGGIELF